MSVAVLITTEFVLSPVIEADWLLGLPPLRRTDLGRWTDAAARRRSLLGSRLLAEGLCRLGYPVDALASLRYPPQSRPTLDLPVDFSLSHCDGRIVCALSTQGAVGIDVERLDGQTADEFRRYLSVAERDWAGRSARRFYSVWTRKEAVAKAAGSGGLRDVARVDTTPSRQSAALDGRLWHTPSVPVGRAHIAHLAVADEPEDLSVVHIGRAMLEGVGRRTARDASAPCCGAVL